MLKDKLSRLSEHITSSKETSEINNDSDRYQKIADCLKGEKCEFVGGCYIRIVTDFEETYAHGLSTIENLTKLPVPRKIHFGNSSDSEPYETDKLLFFDMETTGLGGSGVVSFLIGFGSITKNGFQVRQYFLPDFHDEEAMLEAVRAEIDEKTVIVSYNGKSFDMPILVDRLIIQRVERNLKYADHVDLLHSARRLYRRRLKDCTLANVEREILDFHRYDDTPGFMVPSIYFDWLNTGNTDGINGVVKHNLLDIISLYFVMYRIAAVFENPEEQISEPDDVLSMAKIYERRREHDKIWQTLEKFDDITRSHNRYDILLVQALSYKRCGFFQKAADIWQKVAEMSSPESFPARIELAKHYEHRVKDYARALKVAELAREICPSKKTARHDLNKRIKRLSVKISRSGKSG